MIDLRNEMGSEFPEGEGGGGGGERRPRVNMERHKQHGNDNHVLFSPFVLYFFVAVCICVC